MANDAQTPKPAATPTPSSPTKPATGSGLIGQTGNKPGGSVRGSVDWVVNDSKDSGSKK
jgi:hypothetical protein